jgi:hypothetical protein
MRVYLSARYERRLELRIYANRLRRAGIHIVSRWLESTTDDEAIDPARAAVDDLCDVVEADVLLAFTDGEPARGGRHVEFGIAIGLALGMRPGQTLRLIVVGPKENVFHSLPGVEHVATFGDVYRSLVGLGARQVS